MATKAAPKAAVNGSDTFDAEVFVPFSVPERQQDAPQPRTRGTWKLWLPDNEHWFEVRGGGSQVEGRYIAWSQRQLQKASRRQREGEIDEAEMAKQEDLFNARFATFIADRVVDTNLVDEDGEKYPMGMELFWSLGATDALQLAFRIQSKRSIWADPKPDEPSSTG